MLPDKARKIQYGRNSALHLKRNSKHLCRPMESVYSCLGLTDSMVISCHLPLRRPEFSQAFCIFAYNFKDLRKTGWKLMLEFLEIINRKFINNWNKIRIEDDLHIVFCKEITPPWIFLKMNGIFRQSCSENRNLRFIFSTLFRKSFCFVRQWERKYCTDTQATLDNIMLCTRCWIAFHLTKGRAQTNRLIIFNIYWFIIDKKFPILKKSLREYNKTRNVRTHYVTLQRFGAAIVAVQKQ